MAKTKSSGESKSQVFKRLYEENPHLLGVSGYDEVLQKYQSLNPNVEITKGIRGIAANIKSALNRKAGGGKSRRGRRGRKRGRPPGTTKAVVAAANTPRTTGASLQTLEEHIDDCLMFAKRIDAEELRDVIGLLRRARNYVILHAGK
jgi:hypothetical protein